MRDPSVFTRGLTFVLIMAIATVPTAARASIFGEENANLGLLVTQGLAELAQFGEAIATAKEQLDLAKDIYAGVGDFLEFDPQAFLDGQKQNWLSQVPLASDVQGFVTDLSSGLGGGHFDARDLYGRFDAYRDAHRRKEAQRALGRTLEPYDAKVALTVSREAEGALANSRTRAQLAGKPEVETISEGLFAVDAAKADPQLLALYMQRRAAAKEAEYQAMKLYAESLGAAPGKAQQLAAMAAGLSAQELARIDDKMSQSVALQQLDRQQKASAKATEAQEADFLWGDIQRTSESTFQPPLRDGADWQDL